MADLERGQRIKALREAHAEYGQKHLAAAAGVSLRAYQAWEAGGGIKVENAKALAKFLKVDWRWLINGETAPAKGRTTPDLMATVNGDVPDDLRAQVQDLHAKVDRIIDALGLEADADQHPIDQISEIASALPGLLAADDETAAATETDSAGS
jgi:transcriptional regulator with XRE-family HTH domain